MKKNSKTTTQAQATTTESTVAPQAAATATKKKTTKVAKATAKKATSAPAPAKTKTTTAKESGPSKKAQVIALISRKHGASLDEIMTATGWQKHTVRGFISIIGKKGTKVESSRSDAGARIYKAA